MHPAPAEGEGQQQRENNDRTAEAADVLRRCGPGGWAPSLLSREPLESRASSPEHRAPSLRPRVGALVLRVSTLTTGGFCVYFERTV